MRTKKPLGSAKDFLTRLYNGLAYLDRKQVGHRVATADFQLKYGKLKQFVTAYPSATEEQCLAWVKTKASLLEALLISKDVKYKTELTNLTNQ